MVGGWWAVGSRMVEPLARCTLYLEPRHAKTEGAEQFPFLEWDSLAFQILRSIRKKRKKNSAPIRRLPRSFENPKKKKKKPLKARHICHCEARKSLTIGGADLFCYGRYIYIYFSFSYRGTRIDRHYYLNDRFTSEKILGIRANIRIYISPVSFNSIEDTAFATRQLFFYVFDIIFRYNRSIQYNWTKTYNKISRWSIHIPESVRKRN